MAISNLQQAPAQAAEVQTAMRGFSQLLENSLRAVHDGVEQFRNHQEEVGATSHSLNS